MEFLQKIWRCINKTMGIWEFKLQMRSLPNKQRDLSKENSGDVGFGLGH
jgi:hypothetical protein